MEHSKKIIREFQTARESLKALLQKPESLVLFTPGEKESLQHISDALRDREQLIDRLNQFELPI